MFRVEDLREEVREPFVGMAVIAEFPCKCRICEKGTQKLVEMGREPRTTKRVHIVIKPLEKYERHQHAWYNESKLIWSALGAFTVALNKLIGFTPKSKSPEEQWKEVKTFVEGKVFQWESVKPAEFVSKVLQKPIPKNLPANLKDAREVWIPVKIVSNKELEALGIVGDLKELHKKFAEEWKREIEEMTEEEVEELSVSGNEEEWDLKDILSV